MYSLNLIICVSMRKPRGVDDLDSCGVRTLANKIASGHMSVATAAECSEAFLGDGAQKAGFKMKKTAPLDFEARINVG